MNDVKLYQSLEPPCWVVVDSVNAASSPAVACGSRQSCRAQHLLSRLFRQSIRFETSMAESYFTGIDSAAESWKQAIQIGRSTSPLWEA